MKKIIIVALFFALKSSAQDLTGISVNLTLRSGDWAFIAGKYSATDSQSIIYINRLRDTMLLANPANFNVNVRFNSMPAIVVYNIYVHIRQMQATLYDQVGNNIANQIKAIVSVPLQSAITSFDNDAANRYLDIRRRGKNFLSDH